MWTGRIGKGEAGIEPSEPSSWRNGISYGWRKVSQPDKRGECRISLILAALCVPPRRTGSHVAHWAPSGHGAQALRFARIHDLQHHSGDLTAEMVLFGPVFGSVAEHPEGIVPV